MSRSAARDMTKGSIVKEILLFAMPLIAGNLLQELYNVVDSIVVGNFVSTDALAAVGSSGVIVRLIVGLFVGIATGASVVIAQYYGAKDIGNIKKAVHTAFAVTIIGGIVLTIAGVLLSGPILRAMGTPEEVFVESEVYLRIFFLGTIFAAGYNMGAGILRGIGDSRHPLYYLCASTVTNIIGDIVLVAVFRMGVVGVALATIASQFVSCVLVLRRMLKTDDIYKLQIKEIRIYGDTMKFILIMGIPSGVQGVIVSVSNVLVQANINGYGADAMAGYAAYLKLDGILSMAIMSFGMAAMTFVGQNYGAGLYDRVKQGALKTWLIGIVYSVIVGILMLCFGRYFLEIFTRNETVIGYGVTTMYIIVPFYIFLATAQIMAGVFRGTGRSVLAMVLLVANFVGIRQIWVWTTAALCPSFKMVLFGYGVSWFTAFLCAVFYFFKGDWMNLKKKKEKGD